jgi:prepilin-type N-terminal cleavage/methylation domain-containing protein
MKKNKGFTLTELLIVVSILVILAAILIGIINPIALVGKANDAERKKDLDRIKKSFEEYYNDKGNYPIDVGNWNIKQNCNSNVFSYLNPWPCDPFGEPYKIIIIDNGKSFKILTNLENESDPSVPEGWYSQNSRYVVENYSITEVNYGVSSSNISWNEYTPAEECRTGCYVKPPGSKDGDCNGASRGCSIGQDCYGDSSCLTCPLMCCGPGCN